MKIVFVSNYLNHHQIPFCNTLSEEDDIEFFFIQTEDMEEERKAMGWGVEINSYPYALCMYEDQGRCQTLIDDADIVIYGGVEDEQYIKPRLNRGGLTIRYSERIYKEGQWKFISPRGLKKKYEDHIRYRKSNVYLMCAGGYVASDFHLIHAYPDKMFTWGYFPKVEHYDIETLIASKGYTDATDNKVIEIMWGGRMIDWKHPEYALLVAEFLSKHNIDYHMTLVGDGNMKASLEEQARALNLGDRISFTGYISPDKVREYMLKADIYLFTSNYLEGWGAVLNESMNCGCAVVCGSGIGAVPSMVKHGLNGLVYKNEKPDELCEYVLELCRDEDKRISIGKAAYDTVKNTWNPDNAAKRFAEFARELIKGNIKVYKDGPLSKAPVVSPAKGYRFTRQWKN